MEIKQGELFWVEIRHADSVGSEQRNLRPWVVVSRTELNRGNTVVAVPLTTQTNKYRPHRTLIPERHMIKDPQCTDQLYDSVVLTDQIRTLDKRRLKQPKIGSLSQTATIGLVETGLAYLFGI